MPVRLPPALEAIRLEHVDNANLGVPAHVTLLFPFVPAAELDTAVIARIAEVVARTRAFDVELTEVASWEPGPTEEGVVWLPPMLAAPFVELTEALTAAFPEYPPYGGLHDEVIPHLTLANRGTRGQRLDIPAVEAAARPGLPFRRRVTTASLLVEDSVGRWRTRRRILLG